MELPKNLKLDLKSSPSKLFSTLLQSSVQVHIYHLQSKSYSEHMALNTFYDEIVGLTDSLIEQYQGKYGIVTVYPSIQLIVQSPIDYIKNLRFFIEVERYTSLKKEDTHLQNITDEIISLIDSTLYKLINLK